MSLPNYIHTICTEQWRLFELDATIDLIDEKMANAVNEKQLSEQRDYMNVVLHIAGKAILGMREIIHLSAFGYPDGALSLARTMYEHLIILATLENRRNDADFLHYIDDYYISYEIARLKALKYGFGICAQDSEKEKEISDELEQVKLQAHRKAQGDYWWLGENNFKSVVEHLVASISDSDLQSFIHELHFAYKRACASIHSNCLGNSLRLGVDVNFTGVDTAPTQDGHALPLWFATTSFIYVAGVAYQMLDLDYTLEKSKLNELAIFYKREEKSE